ncbi:MAG: hypothetical protein LC745_07840 [Planctomycetia bacterium]|nr:hypothetical protein [Planctomycetia bacterium]
MSVVTQGRTDLAAGSGRPTPGSADSPRFGPVLTLWVALTVVIQGGVWLAGFRTTDLATAVDQGAARVEALGVVEAGDELILKAIRTQHETLPFWTVLAFLGDFLAEPTATAARAVAAATAFGAIAALRGRVIGFERALAGCAAAQGFWVLGLAVRAALMAGLRRGDVETSAALFLPPGTYPAAACLGLRQLDPFVTLGWAAIALGACRRGQVAWPGAVAVVAVLGLAEAGARVGLALVMGSAVRLALVPS